MEQFIAILGALLAYRLLAPVLDRVSAALWGNPNSVGSKLWKRHSPVTRKVVTAGQVVVEPKSKSQITDNERHFLGAVGLVGVTVLTGLIVKPIFNAHATESWVLPTSIGVLLAVCALGIAVSEYVLVPTWIWLSRSKLTVKDCHERGTDH